MDIFKQTTFDRKLAQRNVAYPLIMYPPPAPALYSLWDGAWTSPLLCINVGTMPRHHGLISCPPPSLFVVDLPPISDRNSDGWIYSSRLRLTGCWRNIPHGLFLSKSPCASTLFFQGRRRGEPLTLHKWLVTCPPQGLIFLYTPPSL